MRRAGGARGSGGAVGSGCLAGYCGGKEGLFLGAEWLELGVLVGRSAPAEMIREGDVTQRGESGVAFRSSLDAYLPESIGCSY